MGYDDYYEDENGYPYFGQYDPLKNYAFMLERNGGDIPSLPPNWLEMRNQRVEENRNRIAATGVKLSGNKRSRELDKREIEQEMDRLYREYERKISSSPKYVERPPTRKEIDETETMKESNGTMGLPMLVFIIVASAIFISLVVALIV